MKCVVTALDGDTADEYLTPYYRTGRRIPELLSPDVKRVAPDLLHGATFHSPRTLCPLSRERSGAVSRRAFIGRSMPVARTPGVSFHHPASRPNPVSILTGPSRPLRARPLNAAGPIHAIQAGRHCEPKRNPPPEAGFVVYGPNFFFVTKKFPTLVHRRQTR